jgi:small GTP-binding protein
MSLPPRDARCKVVFVGDAASGKSSLLAAYTKGVSGEQACRQTATAGFDIVVRRVSVADDTTTANADGYHHHKEIELELWDTAGQERFRALVRSHLREARAVLLCIDMTRPETLANLHTWFEEIARAAADQRRAPIVVLVGTKYDVLLAATADAADAAAAAEDLGAQFVTPQTLEAKVAFHQPCDWSAATSAMSGYGIGALFERLVRELVEARRASTPRRSSNAVHLESAPPPRLPRAERERWREWYAAVFPDAAAAAAASTANDANDGSDPYYCAC